MDEIKIDGTHSTDGITPKRSVTRKPLYIYSQLKNSNDEEEKTKFRQIIAQIKANKELHLGAAVGRGDSFFDAMAQALNELKDRGQILINEDIKVRYLRHLCQQYALETPKGAWLDEALLGVGLERDDYVSGIITTDEDIKRAGGNLGGTKATLRGTFEIEGTIFCEKFGVEIRLLELSEVEVDEETSGFYVRRTKIGKGKNIVHLLKDGKHYVPLLSSLNEDVAAKIKVSSEVVYGCGVRKRSAVDLMQEVDMGAKKARFDANTTNSGDLEFSMSNGLHSTLKAEVQEEEEGMKNLANDFVIREPLLFYRQLKQANNDAEQRRIKEVLKKISAILPAELKIAAAVGKGDSFFDALAQALLELSLISLDECFNLRNLRKICRQHAAQAQNDAWLSAALARAGENLAYYSKHIEFTAADIDNGCGDAINLVSAISGRLDIEGKIISEKFNVKIKLLELEIDEAGDLKFMRKKVGKAKKLVYLLKYQNHFVPLLSSIDNDITDKIKVPMEVVYGYSESRKRVNAESDEENHGTKKARLDLAAFDSDDFEKRAEVQAPTLQAKTFRCAAKSFEAYTPNFRAIPYRLLALLYQLDLSALCLLRKTLFQAKYAALTLNFGGAELEKFNDININYKNKAICLQIEYVDNYYKDNVINFGKLFAKEKRSFSLNYYFENFVKYFHAKTGNSLDDIQYLVIYTNAALELTEDNKLKSGRFSDFFAFEFVALEKCQILKHFLCLDKQLAGRGCYQFSKDAITRAELFKRLKFSNSSTNDLKAQFLDKLVFAVKQPVREELNCFIRNEIKNKQIVVTDYISLQTEALNVLAANKKQETCLIYEFNLLLSFLRQMLLKDNGITAINTASYAKNNDLILHYEAKISYVKVFHSLKSIGYSQLFPNKKQGGFTLNNCFQLYLENAQKFPNLAYFIIYTEASLDITEENVFKKQRCRYFYAFKFNKLVLAKEQLEIFKDCACYNEAGLYRFSQEDTKKLMELLELPTNYAIATTKNVAQIKAAFLASLIFAVEQPSVVELANIIKTNEIGTQHSYEVLQEVALRWSESHEFEALTKDITKQLLQAIEANQSSYQPLKKNIEKEMNFAKAMAGPKHYHEFLAYCLSGAGKRYLAYLEREDINLKLVSNMLSGSKGKGFAAFKRLCDLWFDSAGNTTQYLQTIKKQNFNLANITNILHQSRDETPKAFLNLYAMLFDAAGNKSNYLKNLEKAGIAFSSVSSILRDAKIKAGEAFKELHDLWFDAQGNKTKYLKNLAREKFKLTTVTSLLEGTADKAAKTFKDLYELWFDSEGQKTQCLSNLQKAHIKLTNISAMIGGARAKVVDTFKSLYKLWFDAAGNKTQYLKTLEREGINLRTMSGILHRTRAQAPLAFKDLYELCFDEQGERTQFLKALNDIGLHLADLSGMLHGVGKSATTVLKDFYKLWFEQAGNKTQYLKTLEKQKIKPKTLFVLLCGAGQYAVSAFKHLYDLLFDAKGNKRHYLENLAANGIKLNDITSFLSHCGRNVTAAFKELYALWLDEQGNKKQCLINLEKAGITLSNMSGILNGAGVQAAQAFKAFYETLIDERGEETKYLKTLKNEKISLAHIFSILHGAGAKAATVFKQFYELWFDVAGNKTQYLKTLQENGIPLSNVSSILNGAGMNAVVAFKNLYELWFDENGQQTKYLAILEKVGMNLTNLTSILHGTGNKAAKAFKDLYATFFDEQGNMQLELKHFIALNKAEKRKIFKLKNLAGILSKTGSTATNAFIDFHDVCFDENGKPTKLLQDFFDNGFKSSNLSSILYGTGVHAPASLKSLHAACFDAKCVATTILNDFASLGLKPGHLCSMLSGANQNLMQLLKQFHDFCFEADTKIYLNNFLSIEAGFTPCKLSKILHGAGANICNALKDFHAACFDAATQNESELLCDFRRVGFMPSDLTNILSMAGSNASLILRKFHKICFNKQNYLSHFLDETDIFTPKTLANILHGVGVNVKKNFVFLHELCFDREGNKKKYLNKLIRRSPNEIAQILHQRLKIDMEFKSENSFCLD